MGKYFEVIWLGRSRQGIFRTAAILSEVLVKNGKYVQTSTINSFDENSPFVFVYNRISDVPINIHSKVEKADFFLIIDPIGLSIFNNNIKSQAKENSIFFINTATTPELTNEKFNLQGHSLFTLDAKRNHPFENLNKNFSINLTLMTLLIHNSNWLSLGLFVDSLPEIFPRWIPSEYIDPSIHLIQSLVNDIQDGKQIWSTVLLKKQNGSHIPLDSNPDELVEEDR